MSVKAERYAFRLVRNDIDSDTDVRASDNLRLFMEWAQDFPTDETAIFGQVIMQNETINQIRAANMVEDTAHNAQATLSSFSG